MYTIVDRTAKIWDITHAVLEYGLYPDSFFYGLGPDWFPPLLNPQFLSPDDPGYPGPNETFEVIGTTINGESRAYPVSFFPGREVIDDQFGPDPVVVAY